LPITTGRDLPRLFPPLGSRQIRFYHPDDSYFTAPGVRFVCLNSRNQ
jgi:hypothetical protein